METEKILLIKFTPPPEKLTLWRRMLAKLPGFCRYCGKAYIEIQPTAEKLDPFIAYGDTGRGCPHRHEGYVRELDSLGCLKRHEFFDNVRPAPMTDQAPTRA